MGFLMEMAAWGESFRGIWAVPEIKGDTQGKKGNTSAHCGLGGGQRVRGERQVRRRRHFDCERTRWLRAVKVWARSTDYIQEPVQGSKMGKKRKEITFAAALGWSECHKGKEEEIAVAMVWTDQGLGEGLTPGKEFNGLLLSIFVLLIYARHDQE